MFTVNLTLTFTFNDMASTEIYTLSLHDALPICSGGIKGFAQRTINNAGAIRWSGGDIWSGSGATINNQAGGLFDLQADQTWTYNQGGAPPVLNNAGTVQKSAGTGTTAFESIVNNGGTLAVQSGTVNMVNGGDSHGNFKIGRASCRERG